MPTRLTHARLVERCHAVAHEVFGTMGRAGGRELLSLDLTMGQFKAMVTLGTSGPRPVGELGRLLGISEPAASLLVDKLVELGTQSANATPHDGRRVLVTLTPDGRERTERLRAGRDEHVLRWLGALDGPGA